LRKKRGMAKGLRSKSRKKCNTEKRKKLANFEQQRNERIAAKISVLLNHNMDVVSAAPLPRQRQTKQPKVSVTTMDVDNTVSSGGVTKKRVTKKKST